MLSDVIPLADLVGRGFERLLADRSLVKGRWHPEVSVSPDSGEGWRPLALPAHMALHPEMFEAFLAFHKRGPCRASVSPSVAQGV